MKKLPVFAIPYLLLAGSWALAQSPNYHVEVHNPAKFDSGEALKETPGQEVAAEHRPLLSLPRQSQANNRPDGALQTLSGPVVNTTAGAGFEGVAANGSAPPDTNMAVGKTYVIQWVNTNFAVYAKDGTLQSGYPKPGNAFWSGFGGACETQNSGDPIIQYDTAADRWIASQFTTRKDSSGNYYQCFAVSRTNDPNGAYNRYAYAFTQFPDYPKISVWKNAYFASYNIFSSTAGGWVGPRICAYDRAAMLAGTSAVGECFNPGSAYGSLLPSDMDGGPSFAPPTDTGYFLDYGNNSLLLWRFTPNFVTPSSATLTGPVSISVASFSPACGGGTCIPQSGGSNLDSLADRLMYRLAYRNFGDHESLVVNQSVTAGTSVGVRWYEIRNPLTSPAIYQQGTFAPDATYRWMGSIAQDKAGNIALGYSASSSSSFTSIRYTGRETTDPLNTLQAEKIEYMSGGAQTSLSRWGDYAAMRIDPSDDCTFWFTTEYIPSTGSFNWRTRIASFSFPSCSATANPDFTISATPSSQTVVQGSGTSYTATVSALNGFSGTVALSVSGLPSGASAVFNPTSVTGSGNSTLSIATASSTPVGTYTLTITGTSGSITKTAAVALVVQSTAPPPAFTLSASPTTGTISAGSQTTYGITVSPQNGFNGTVAFSVSGLPARTSASFNPSSSTTGTTLTVKANKSAKKGTSTLTITGTSGSLTATTQVTLTIQ